MSFILKVIFPDFKNLPVYLRTYPTKVFVKFQVRDAEMNSVSDVVDYAMTPFNSISLSPESLKNVQQAADASIDASKTTINSNYINFTFRSPDYYLYKTIHIGNKKY